MGEKQGKETEGDASEGSRGGRIILWDTPIIAASVKEIPIG